MVETKIGDNILAILQSADKFTLVFMAGKNTQVNYPDAFHIGFMLYDLKAVTDTFEILKVVASLLVSRT